MLSEEAILKIQVAIYQLRVYGSGRRDGMLAAQAITMLEQVIESIEKQQLEYTTPHAA
jgi:hypothetical protein